MSVNNSAGPLFETSSLSTTSKTAAGRAADNQSAAAVDAQSKRPSSSRFKQQQLPAWQPILTAGTVLPVLFVIGVAFVPIGVILLTVSANVEQYVVDYTQCNSSDVPAKTCADQVAEDYKAGCKCRVVLEIQRPIAGPVFFYYGLTNYYQNHRRYVKSRDDNQLMGDRDASLADCAPFDRAADGKAIAPCGAIANSLFNDSFILKLEGSNEVPMLHTGIAWPSDKQLKFQNPSGELTGDAAFKDTARPLNWQNAVWQLDPANNNNNGYENERLIVWMRTAALPTFRKLWARLDQSDSSSQFAKGLPAGNYSIEVEYHYPVTGFGGTKRFILTNTSALGGKNSFLGAAYIAVGCVCLVLGVVLLFVHVRYGKRPSDTIITNLTPW